MPSQFGDADWGSCWWITVPAQEVCSENSLPCTALLHVTVKACLRLSSTGTRIKQTYIGQAGKKQFVNLFHALSEVPTLWLFRFNTPRMQGSLKTQPRPLAGAVPWQGAVPCRRAETHPNQDATQH